ncbi:MAG: thioesterase family protein [Cyanobacteria bacterium J06597_16]
MTFTYTRTIRFHETDAAGVVYFANLLTLCHEAYEASLAEAGIALKTFFSTKGGLAVPVVHAEADFYRPLHCGDAIAITLTPTQLTHNSFEIDYKITPQRFEQGALGTSNPDNLTPDDLPPGDSNDKPLATALTRHVCINPKTHRRQELTAPLLNWMQAASTDGTDADD